jgi:predicted O-methyltransferase YrrM
MDWKVRTVLDEYEARLEAEHALFRELDEAAIRARVDQFLIPVGAVVARFLNDMVRATGATRILELGTSHGYSTVWLAEAARATGGRVTTTELSAAKIAHAKQQLEKAGLADHVEFLQGDARTTLAALSGPFDFVLLDLWKDLYVACFEIFRTKLAPGAYVVADNMIEPENARPDALVYRRHVRGQSDFHSILLPLGQGIEVSRYVEGLDEAGLFPLGRHG